MSNEFLCFQCGEADLVRRLESFSGDRNGETFTVDVEGLCCPKCQLKTMDADQGVAFGLALSDAYRKAHDRLTSAELKALRRSQGMSQADFSLYLGVGIASLKRWESGQIQDAAMDSLMRLKTDPDAASENAERVSEMYGGFPGVAEKIGTQQWSPQSNRYTSRSRPLVVIPKPPVAA